tara:strand:+ start:6441 stop:7952 length:1512 start_codon:yes stop_codon:yes gene_type:complete
MKLSYLIVYLVLYVGADCLGAAAASSAYGRDERKETNEAFCRRVASIHNDFFEKPITNTSSQFLREAFDGFKTAYDTHATSTIEVDLEGLSSRQRVRLMKAITNYKLSKKPSHTEHSNSFWGFDPETAKNQKKHVDLMPTVFVFGDTSITVQNQYFYVWDPRKRKFVSNQPGNFFAYEIGSYDEEYDDILGILADLQDLPDPMHEEEERSVLRSPLAVYILRAVINTRKGWAYTSSDIDNDIGQQLKKELSADNLEEIAEIINLYSIVFDLEIARRLEEGDIYRSMLPVGVGIDLIMKQRHPWEHLFLSESPFHVFAGHGGLGHPESRIESFLALCRSSRGGYLRDSTLLRKHLVESYCKTDEGDESDTEGDDIWVGGTATRRQSIVLEGSTVPVIDTRRARTSTNPTLTGIQLTRISAELARHRATIFPPAAAERGGALISRPGLGTSITKSAFVRTDGRIKRPREPDEEIIIISDDNEVVDTVKAGPKAKRPRDASGSVLR